MDNARTESLPPPPGVVSSIKAGFDAIAAHAAAILLPFTLDLFLWLGPRLSMEKLFLSIQTDVISIWRAGGVSGADIQRVSEWYSAMLPKVKLFWLVRTIPIGITSLLFSRDVTQTPLGAPSILSVKSDADLLGWMFSLTLIGWIGGGLYFRLISRLVAANDQEKPVGLVRAIGQTILLSIFWAGIGMVLGLPLVVILSLLVQVSSVVAQIAILFFSFLSMWIVVPLFFWPHGVFVKKQNALMSIFSSVRLARLSLPTSSIFVLTIFLLSVGLNFLWSIPPADSWMTLVGILGHAFVTTALLAASFIYYRDMNSWLQVVMERMKSSAGMKRV